MDENLKKKIETFEIELSQINRAEPSVEELPMLIARGRSLVSDLFGIAAAFDHVFEEESIQNLIGDTIDKLT